MVALLGRRIGRDQAFVGIPPGAIPPRDTQPPIERVSGGQEYSGVIPVAFAPPPGVTPGLIGTLVDGSADPRDVTASIVDLARRGWLTIHALGADGSEPVEGQKAQDWLLTAPAESDPGPRPDDTPNQFERDLLGAIFADGSRSQIRMSQLTHAQDGRLFAARESLYRSVVDHGWYHRSPRVSTTVTGCLLIAAAVVIFILLAASRTPLSIISGIVAGGAVLLLPRWVNRRVPRTALGTAVRVQSLGFKEYLATAEADQFTFEEAAGIFSRYLPYAIVFGVADHWAAVFAQVASRAHVEGYGDLGFDFDWFDAWIIADAVSHLGGLGDLGALEALGGMADMADGTMTEALSGVGEIVGGVGDFISDIDLGDFFDF